MEVCYECKYECKKDLEDIFKIIDRARYYLTESLRPLYLGDTVTKGSIEELQYTINMLAQFQGFLAGSADELNLTRLFTDWESRAATTIGIGENNGKEK